MSGWVTFPLKNASEERERNRPVFFLPALHQKWMFMAQDAKQDPTLTNPKSNHSTSIGFYCGLLRGQTFADYPSLTKDLPKYPMDPYDPVYLATSKIWNSSQSIHVTSDGSLGNYRILRLDFALSIKIRGSIPSVPPFLSVRECKYFRFSPYKLKQ